MPASTASFLLTVCTVLRQFTLKRVPAVPPTIGRRARTGAHEGVVSGLPLPVIALIVSGIVFAPLASWLAVQRGRSWAAWFLFGVALGPIAVGLLLMAPPGRCPACGTRTRGWPRRCEGCGVEFRRKPAETGSDVDGAPTTIESPEPEPGRVARRASPAGSPDEPGRRSATTLGRRPTPQANPAASSRSSGTVAILGSGIFIGGSASLQIGSRYLLAKVGSKLHVLGPIHISPSAVAARITLADIEATVLADQLLLNGRGGTNLSVAFSSVAVEPGVDLEQQLLAPTRRRAVAT